MSSVKIKKIFKIGYVPLADSAPLLVARHEGYFKDEGVEVKLEEQVGWATVRDKLIYGEVDLASTLIGIPYAIHNGVGCFQREMTVPLILSSNGNALTLASECVPEGEMDTSFLKEQLNQRAEKTGRKWIFATVHPYSSHLILLFQWLKEHLSENIKDIEINFIPPQLYPELLEAGLIDGYCAGEPWGSLSEDRGTGRVISRSDELNPNHPEKVLTLTKETLQYYADEVRAIGRALIRACKKCEDPSYRDTFFSLLAECSALEDKVDGFMEAGEGKHPFSYSFFGEDQRKPNSDIERWVIKGLKEAGLFREKVVKTGEIMNPDLLFKT